MSNPITYWKADLNNVKIEMREAVGLRTASSDTLETIEGFAIVDIATDQTVSRHWRGKTVFSTEQEARAELAWMVERKKASSHE